MSSTVNCNECDSWQKLRTVQGAPIIHEGRVVYWRRKKCRDCGALQKTIEVPLESVPHFHTIPASKDMS
jgi:hypothetical protein